MLSIYPSRYSMSTSQSTQNKDNNPNTYPFGAPLYPSFQHLDEKQVSQGANDQAARGDDEARSVPMDNDAANCPIAPTSHPVIEKVTVTCETPRSRNQLQDFPNAAPPPHREDEKVQTLEPSSSDMSCEFELFENIGDLRPSPSSYKSADSASNGLTSNVVVKHCMIDPSRVDDVVGMHVGELELDLHRALHDSELEGTQALFFTRLPSSYAYD
eukprot:GEZU01007907.1.p1 GENE.GEZU01007907.1~~GEZU01007907.1.p1  ORF type:complete len:214 (-),score=26.75 GEZU01007907.1:252-893(-)